MKRNSKNSTHEQSKAGNVSVLLLATCLSLALFSCSSSSSPTSTPDAKINQHLVYQHPLNKDATLKPYQTVVLNSSSLQDDHLGSSTGAGYHAVPYEISNAGKYKYCIPDNDTHLTQVELFDPAGALVGNWKKGEPCTSVSLVTGKYSIHVHLDTTDSDPPIFMKPHDVKITQTGTMKGVLKSIASYAGPIPQNQFLNLKVDSLADVLAKNDVQGLTEGWGVSAPFPPDFAPSYQVLGIIFDDVTTRSTLRSEDLFYLKPVNDKVALSQGNIRIGTWTEYRPVALDYINWIGKLGKGQPHSTDVNALFRFSSSGTIFNLYTNCLPGGTYYLPFAWYKSEYEDYLKTWFAGGLKPESGITLLERIDFNVRVRYGTTSGLTYPAMLANEVALFDSAYGSTGFPANTHYWIVSADLKDFSEFSFDNPTNHIKTVIAGRGARAQIFQNPSFQGDSAYISPPVDGEMLMTGTDNALLINGTVGSIRIEPNSNDIPVNEYEYHVIVSANSCIGCDLRGFDASQAGTENWGFYGDYVELRSVNFKDSDLSSANFSLARGKYKTGRIIGCNFENVNFTGADLTHDAFWSCNFRKTDFTKTVLSNVIFSNEVSDLDAAAPFYDACPKFEYTDLSTVTNFGSYFKVATGSGYDADAWWNTQRTGCRPSIAYSKVKADLFADKRLWQFVDAQGVDFSNMNLEGYVFAGSNLRNAIFKGASLKGTIFVRADLTGADVSGADLTSAHLEGATLDGVNLNKAKTLSKAFLSGVSVNSPNLANLDMSGAQLKSGDYTNWDGHTFDTFHAASINGAYMYNTKLNGADLSGAFLNSVSWFGAEATGENATMIGTHFEHADLPGLNLKKTHLQRAIFTDAQMVNADLSTLNSPDYSFNGTTFYQANLRGANLSGANLDQAALDSALIYAGDAPMYTYIEVLDDPAINPGHYRFYQQNYFATVPPASTNNITTCPNGKYSPDYNCGDIGSEYWSSPTYPPKPPTDCTKRAPLPGETPSDDGMVLVCTSHRHPVNP